MRGEKTDGTGSRWNVDVWFRKKADIAETEKYCDAVRRRVSRDPADQAGADPQKALRAG